MKKSYIYTALLPGLLAGALALTESAIWATAPFANSGASTQLASSQSHSQLILVEIYADWCPSCTHIANAWKQLEKRYSGKVRFVQLDVSNPHTVAIAKVRAKQLGLEQWFMMHQTHTSLVGLFNAGQRDTKLSFVDEANPAVYAKQIDLKLKAL